MRAAYRPIFASASLGVAACVALGLAVFVGDAARAASEAPRKIGSVAAANNDVLGTPPEQEARLLELGLKLFESERVETSPVGAGQFLFLDQTSLTVWPNSDIVLDKYIYDPDKQTGEMALSATRGVLRFIGGRISKTTDVNIRTPQGVVAIRGGMAQLVISPKGTKVTNITSEYVRLDTGSGQLTLSRPMAIGEMSSEDGPPQFLGVGGEAAAAELYQQPLGVGDGGVQEPVTEETVNQLAVQSGVSALGFGDQGAARSQPISTRGERQPAPLRESGEIVVDEGDDKLTNPKEDLPPLVVVSPPPDDPDPPVVDNNDPDPPVVDNNDPDPPVVDNDDPDPPSPFAGFTGAVIEAADPTQASIVLQEGQERGQLTDAERVTAGALTLLNAAGPDGAAASFVELDGFFAFPGEGVVAGRPADVISFVDTDVFYLSALRSNDGAPDALALSFFGTPTPREVWSAAPGADIPAFAYLVSVDLFSGVAGMLPERFGDPFGPDSFGDLLLIGDPDSPVIAAFDPNVDTSSKWMLGALNIDGEGAGQTSSFGVLSALALPTETGAPSLSGEMIFIARLDASGAPAFGVLPVGTVDDGAGATAYGDAGDYLVLGTGGPYALDNDPDFDSTPATFSEWTEPGVTDEAFGRTRLAVLGGTGTFLDADRIGVAAPVAGSAFEATATIPLEAILDGGFAVALGQSFTPAASEGDRISDPYLLVTRAPEGVRVAFDRGTNVAAAEFRDLEPSGDGPKDATGVRLNWGGGGRGAFADENLFVALDGFGPEGAITGQTQSLAGRSGAADTVENGAVRQNAFRGALAVSTAVGDGGVFPAGVDTTPEFLRWGWWAGEYTQRPDDPNADFAGRTDRLGLGAWVAGVRSDIASVRAQMIEASYSGFAVANVTESTAGGSAAYVDGGSFNMTYDFAARSGQVAINGIAGENLTSNVSEALASAGHHYGGDLKGFSGSGVGGVRGAFFTGGGSPIKATAGNFEFSADTPGKRSTAVGIFGAERP